MADPKTGRILSVEQQFEPESNDVVVAALKKVLPLYPKVDAFVMDRNCKFVKRAKQETALHQIKTYAIDKFHGKGHNKKCVCNPFNHRGIMRRLRGVNTSVSEQVWAWFRGYCSTLNTMNPLRHRFFVLAYAKRHNAMINSGDVSHLPPAMHSTTKRRSGHYPCNNPKAAKAMKVKGTTKAMKVQKTTKAMKVQKTPKAMKVMKNMKACRCMKRA